MTTNGSDPPDASAAPAEPAPARPTFFLHQRLARPPGPQREFALEGPWKFGDPVHETLTQLALRQAGVIGPGVRYVAPEAWEFVRGAFWNDDPQGMLFANNAGDNVGFSFGVDFAVSFKRYEAEAARAGAKLAFGPDDELLARTHFGDLQFLHAMASRTGEPAAVTLKGMRTWAEFAYRVAVGDVPDTTLVGDTLVRGYFPRHAKTTVRSFLLVGSKGDAPRRALGSLMHMIQDSYAGGHAERERARSPRGRIVAFHTYGGQDHGKHGHADEWQGGATDDERVDRLPGARDAVAQCAALLAHWSQRAPWEDVARFLDAGPFATVDAPRAASPGEEYEAET